MVLYIIKRSPHTLVRDYLVFVWFLINDEDSERREVALVVTREGEGPAEVKGRR